MITIQYSVAGVVRRNIIIWCEAYFASPWTLCELCIPWIVISGWVSMNSHIKSRQEKLKWWCECVRKPCVIAQISSLVGLQWPSNQHILLNMTHVHNSTNTICNHGCQKSMHCVVADRQVNKMFILANATIGANQRHGQKIKDPNWTEFANWSKGALRKSHWSKISWNQIKRQKMAWCKTQTHKEHWHLALGKSAVDTLSGSSGILVDWFEGSHVCFVIFHKVASLIQKLTPEEFHWWVTEGFCLFLTVVGVAFSKQFLFENMLEKACTCSGVQFSNWTCETCATTLNGQLMWFMGATAFLQQTSSFTLSTKCTMKMEFWIGLHLMPLSDQGPSQQQVWFSFVVQTGWHTHTHTQN